ncbi:MAG: hypothetical protein AAGN46_08625, partial [Acidobacteriota bacterium]
ATSASGHSGLFNLISADNLCEGEWSFATYLNKFDRRVQSDPETLVIDPLWTDWDMDVVRATAAVGYGITDRIELALMLPYYDYEADGIEGQFRQVGILNGQQFIGEIDQSGIGDVRVGAKFQLARGEGWATGLRAFIDLPTGDDDEAISTGDTGFGVGFVGNTGNWVFNATYFDPGDGDFFLPVSEEVQLGIGYGHDVNERLEWITELAGIVYVDDDNGEHDAADIASGVRYHLTNPDWAVNAALRVDLSDTNFDYSPVGGLIGLSYAPKNRYELAITKDGSGTGTVRVTGMDGAGFECGPVCAGDFHCGANVDLTVEPAAGSRFGSWSGDCGGEGSSISLTLDDDKACTATFIKQYDLTVEIRGVKNPKGDDPGTGKVQIAGPAGTMTCPGDCKATADVGSTFELTAMPADESTFGGWSVDCDGTDPRNGFELTKDTTCVATFVGPERPCDVPPVVGDFAKCDRYVKRGEWNCDSETFTFLVDGFADGSAELPEALLPTDANERKTPLCDLVNFMRMCPEFSACIAGRQTAGEDLCLAEERAARVAGFLAAQARYSFFDSLRPETYDWVPSCTAEEGTGRSVEVFLEK